MKKNIKLCHKKNINYELKVSWILQVSVHQLFIKSQYCIIRLICYNKILKY